MVSADELYRLDPKFFQGFAGTLGGPGPCVGHCAAVWWACCIFTHDPAKNARWRMNNPKTADAQAAQIICTALVFGHTGPCHLEEGQSSATGWFHADGMLSKVWLSMTCVARPDSGALIIGHASLILHTTTLAVMPPAWEAGETAVKQWHHSLLQLPTMQPHYQPYTCAPDQQTCHQEPRRFAITSSQTNAAICLGLQCGAV